MSSINVLIEEPVFQMSAVVLIFDPRAQSVFRSVEKEEKDEGQGENEKDEKFDEGEWKGRKIRRKWKTKKMK
ncbi:Protein of unknown function [Gryllus bimaculatus]|nr:Protein of unknown function [Gryllus bimaculatus]